MDQDYNKILSLRFHDSAPVCSILKISSPRTYYRQPVDKRDTYTRNYGDPQWGWEPSACSNDARHPGGAFTFADDSLPSDPVRAVTPRELRARINHLRFRFGLTPFFWTDPMIASGETIIRAVHMTELRTALTEAHVAAGRDAPTYTDDPIIAGITPVKAVHFTELRTAVVSLEQ